MVRKDLRGCHDRETCQEIPEFAEQLSDSGVDPWYSCTPARGCGWVDGTLVEYWVTASEIARLIILLHKDEAQVVTDMWRKIERSS